MDYSEMTNEDLAVLWRDGRDEEAAMLLMGRFNRMLHKYARQYVNQHNDVADLYQQAVIGLLVAAESFDETRGVHFATHASWNVRGSVANYLRDHGRLLAVSRATYLAHACPFDGSLDYVLDAWESASAADSGGGGGYSLKRFNSAISVEVFGDDLDEGLDALGAMKALDERKQQIVQMCVLGDKSQRAAASALGISQMHVSRLLREALQEMRWYLYDGIGYVPANLRAGSGNTSNVAASA